MFKTSHDVHHHSFSSGDLCILYSERGMGGGQGEDLKCGYTKMSLAKEPET